MKILGLLFILFTQSIMAIGNFAFLAENQKTFMLEGDAVRIITAARDSDGNAFLLVKSSFSKATYSNKDHQNYLKTISTSTDEVQFILAKIDVNQKVLWTNVLKSKEDNGIVYSDLKISPQGNIALTFIFSQNINGPNGKQWVPIQQDALFLFLNNHDGSLLKDIHLSGDKNESNAKVKFATGGEVFITAKSNSSQVKYLGETFTFKTFADEHIVKDIIISLNSKFSEQWSRSVEPASVNEVNTYKDNLLVMSLAFSKDFSVYKKNGFISHFTKPINSPVRGIVFAFDKEGYKKWATEFSHHKNAVGLSGLKVFPNGNIGIAGTFKDKVSINHDSLLAITLPFEENGQDYFQVALNEVGIVDKSIVLDSKTPLTIYGNGDNHTLLTLSPNPNDVRKFYYHSSQSGSGTISVGHDEKCTNHIIFNDQLSPIYREQGGRCFNGNHTWLRLSQGKIKSLHPGLGMNYMEVPYGEEEENNEDIPGLAFKPKFYQGEASLDLKATLSYAIPQNSNTVIIYYPPKGQEQLDFLSNSLVQATLNQAYFRGYSILVFTSENMITPDLIQSYLTPLSKKEYFKEIKQWHVVGYQDRAEDLIKSYDKSANYIYTENSETLSMALYHPEINPLLMDTEQKQAAIGSKLLPSFFVTGKYPNLQFREKIRELQKTMITYGHDLSHLHFDGVPLLRHSFSAVNSYGEEKSENIFNQLITGNCLDEKGFLNMDPREKAFLSKCIKNGIPLTAQDESESHAKEDLLIHLDILYGKKGHNPYLDQEYFEFFDYVRHNHVVARKKSDDQGDKNSVLK